VSLIVHDDGAGLPAGVESNRLSHGIIGMRQRVRALNGTFKISSRPGSGTTIEVFIPLPTPGLTNKSAYSEDMEDPAPRSPAAPPAPRSDAIENPAR
jgi:signal transduction histidine kinase